MKFSTEIQLQMLYNVAEYLKRSVISLHISEVKKWNIELQFKQILIYVETGNHVQIVNYCSFLSNYKEFAFDFTSETKKNEYVALNCECMSEDGYDLNKISKKVDKCSHSPMISDKYIIRYLYSMSSEEPTYEALEKYSKDIFRAFTNAISLN